ncbi:FHA domain-containing protein [Nocardia sp. CA-129566]|uniref:FHA domain-containing protein n=1 Tax=Nocardia sp. CA-129566 TaxID=3239976 RepID=UPI003D993E1B
MAIATCPDGHQSVAMDYCDVCGSPIGAPAPTVAVALCPSCGAPSNGRFCEVCGHDSALPTPVARTPASASTEIGTATVVSSTPSVVTWVATVTADRDFYDRVQARKGPDVDQVEFPAYYPERRITLRGNDILIGKHSVSQGLQPEIDLGIAPADAGVSRAHATIHIADTGISITDLGSTNGTSLNGSEDLIPANVAVPLASGDRIHLGGWTTIIVTAEPA